MSLWLRVFGAGETEPSVTAIQKAVSEVSPGARARFEHGDRGWTKAEITLPGGGTPIFIERYWRDEEGIRQELQTWAAWLETCDYSDHYQRLMQHMISTQQVFTMRRPLDHGNEIVLDNVLTAICRLIAQAADGVYQVDQEGFFSADGTMLLREY